MITLSGCVEVVFVVMVVVEMIPIHNDCSSAGERDSVGTDGGVSVGSNVNSIGSSVYILVGVVIIRIDITYIHNG